VTRVLLNRRSFICLYCRC